jgi:DNA-binding IclR family transcriptional regulator
MELSVDRGAGSPADLNTVLGKLVSVLDAFTPEDEVISLAELGRRTGMPKGTLHRVVGNLVAVRMLDRTENGYRLSGKLFELGMRASVERDLIEVAVPFMQDLYERTHETVHLGMRQGTEVVYVNKIGGHRPALSPSRVGGRMPLHCTAIGKVLLAYSGPKLARDVIQAGLPALTPRTITAPGVLLQQLQRIRETGVAFEHEESAVGVVCVASAVLDPDGRAASVKATAAALATAHARREEMRLS